MKHQLNQWADLLLLVAKEKDKAQSYTINIAKTHKPVPATLGDGSAVAICHRCDIEWPCGVIEDIEAWVEIL